MHHVTYRGWLVPHLVWANFWIVWVATQPTWLVTESMIFTWAMWNLSPCNCPLRSLHQIGMPIPLWPRHFSPSVLSLSPYQSSFVLFDLVVQSDKCHQPLPFLSLQLQPSFFLSLPLILPQFLMQAFGPSSSLLLARPNRRSKLELQISTGPDIN